MSTSFRHWGRGVVAGAALLLGAAGWQTSAVAGSDNSSNTYAGDYAALGLPAGTFLVIDYVGYRHGDAFIQNDNNFFGKIGQPHFIPSDVSLFTDITRLVYFTSLASNCGRQQSQYRNIRASDC